MSTGKMSKDILLVVDSVSNEKGVNKDVVFEAIEEALATVTAKRYDEEVAIRVSLDRNTGEYETFRFWTVVADDAEEESEFPDKEMVLSKAKELDAELDVGDVVEEPIESVEFGRIAAQQAKQAIVERLREAERDKVRESFSEKLGELVHGVVKKVTRDAVLIELGESAEAVLPREEMIPREAFRLNDRLRAVLSEVRPEKRGPQLVLSRNSVEMLRQLFTIEVPEIGEEVIEVKGIARDPGSRAKIAVKTNDGRIDPIGACVGMRGARVQAVSSELNGERIDIVLWDDNPAQLVINAMAPAEIGSIVLDEDTKSMDLIVTEEHLSQAIGRSGQNVRLASQLTGWTLNVMTESDAEKKTEQESHFVCDLFVRHLGVEQPVAQALVREGFSSLDEVAYVAEEELKAIEELDEALIASIRESARDALLAQALTGKEIGAQPAEDLLSMEGMEEGWAFELASRGVLTMEDLAEQSVDDIVDLDGLDEEKAAQLIMTARAPWFADSKQ